MKICCAIFCGRFSYLIIDFENHLFGPLNACELAVSKVEGSIMRCAFGYRLCATANRNRTASCMSGTLGFRDNVHVGGSNLRAIYVSSVGQFRVVGNGTTFCRLHGGVFSIVA